MEEEEHVFGLLKSIFIYYFSFSFLTRRIYMYISSIAIQDRAVFPLSVLRASLSCHNKVPDLPTRNPGQLCLSALWHVMFLLGYFPPGFDSLHG